MKHLKDSLPILLDDPTFPEKFIPQSSGDAAPSTSKQVLHHEEEIREQTEAAKCFLEEEQATKQVPSLGPLSPKKEGLKFSSLEPQAPSMIQKCHIIEGPVKCSKKLNSHPKMKMSRLLR